MNGNEIFGFENPPLGQYARWSARVGRSTSFWYSDLPFSRGIGYEDNFRKGRISRDHATLIYGWLRQHHPEYAQRVDDALSEIQAAAPDAPSGGAEWTSFIRRHARLGHLEIVRVPSDSLNIVAIAELDPVVAILRRAERFVFRLFSPIAGYGLGFQWMRGEWLPLPLSTDQLYTPVLAGRQVLPIDPATGMPAPLAEDADMGRHRFVILVAPQAVCERLAKLLMSGQRVATANLDEIASNLHETEVAAWGLYRTSIIVTD